MLDWARGGRPRSQPPRRQRGVRTQLVLSQAKLQRGGMQTGRVPCRLQSQHHQVQARLMLHQVLSQVDRQRRDVLTQQVPGQL